MFRARLKAGQVLRVMDASMMPEEVHFRAGRVLVQMVQQAHPDIGGHLRIFRHEGDGNGQNPCSGMSTLRPEARPMDFLEYVPVRVRLVIPRKIRQALTRSGSADMVVALRGLNVI